MENKKVDLIEKAARERARNFYTSSPQIKTVKLLNRESKEMIKCHECNNINFKFYRKVGMGMVLGKRNKIMSDLPYKHNFICKCGVRLILKEGTFEYAKLKYGCSAQKCPFGKVKMDKDCLKCKYIYEK
jgi:hypothetical protein